MFVNNYLLFFDFIFLFRGADTVHIKKPHKNTSKIFVVFAEKTVDYFSVLVYYIINKFY